MFFLVACLVNLLDILPGSLIRLTNEVSTLLLATAMAFLGLRTHRSAVKQAGVKPLILAALLFIYLFLGGYVVNEAVMYIL